VGNRDEGAGQTCGVNPPFCCLFRASTELPSKRVCECVSESVSVSESESESESGSEEWGRGCG
jgi:hypothetical protein